MTRSVVGILIGIAVVATLVIATLNQIKVSCEVCIAYRGQQVCEKASAADEADAIMQATASACAQISGGVTDGIQCNSTPPLSTACTE